MTSTAGSTVRSVLVVGATGGIGSRVVAAAQRHGLTVRALVRDERRAAALPGAEIVVGDVEDVASLVPAVEGMDAIVLTLGSDGDPRRDSTRLVDYGGVANVLRALGSRRPRIALMTSIYMTRADGAYADLLTWKRRSERLVRVSGAPYTIVRPSWFDRVSRGDDRLVLEQGDAGDGGVSREQIAEVLVRSLLHDDALGRTFELYAGPGQAPADWDALFGALDADAPGDVDGAHDRRNLPVDAEPAQVRADLDEVRAT